MINEQQRIVKKIKYVKYDTFCQIVNYFVFVLFFKIIVLLWRNFYAKKIKNVFLCKIWSLLIKYKNS
jgi:hypothetical protein